MKDLGLLCEDILREEWRGLSVDQTPRTKYVQPPKQMKPNLSIRDVKLGTATPNMAADSLAGNVEFGNPFEQEEVVDAPISKLKIFQEIENISQTLDSSSPLDRVALMALAQLKTKLK